EFFGPLDEPEPGDDAFLILPVARLFPGRFLQQALPLVESHRLDADPGTAGNLSDGQWLHRCTPPAFNGMIHPVPYYRVKGFLRWRNRTVLRLGVAWRNFGRPTAATTRTKRA